MELRWFDLLAGSANHMATRIDSKNFFLVDEDVAMHSAPHRRQVYDDVE